MKVDRADVAAALRVEDLDGRYGLNLKFRGRWARTRRCPRRDHGAASLAVSRDGRWRCHACLEGGDFLQLAGAFEGLESAADLPRLLDLMAEVCGIVPASDFGGEAPAPRKPRPPIAAPEAVDVRVERAHGRAAWLWSRLAPCRAGGDVAIAEVEYVRGRGLDPEALDRAGELRLGPMLLGEREATEIGGPRHRPEGGANLEPIWTLYRQWVEDGFGVALPVRHVDDGRIVDVRLRRVRRRTDDSPKVIGMLGGVASHEGELVGCYGRPNLGDDMAAARASCAIVVEGAFDYLTTCAAAPGAWVLGAVDAGQYPKVAAHAAAWCAATGAPLLLIAQEDGPGGAAVRSVDLATVEAVHLGVTPRWLECSELRAKDVNAAWQRDRAAVSKAIAAAVAG